MLVPHHRFEFSLLSCTQYALHIVNIRDTAHKSVQNTLIVSYTIYQGNQIIPWHTFVLTRKRKKKKTHENKHAPNKKDRSKEKEKDRMAIIA